MLRPRRGSAAEIGPIPRKPTRKQVIENAVIKRQPVTRRGQMTRNEEMPSNGLLLSQSGDQEVPQINGEDGEIIGHENNMKKTGNKRKIQMPTEKSTNEDKAKTRKLGFIYGQRQNIGRGQMLTIGQGDVGQLGLGEDMLERSRPSLVNFDQAVVDVSVGGLHTVCLLENGEIYTFGCNDEGALGRDTSSEGSEFVPGKVDIPARVVQVAAGDSHTAALTDKGKVYFWGNFRDSDGVMGLLVAGQKETKPLPLLEQEDVKKIASGNDHLVMLSVDGRIFTCGCAEQGQLGRIAECFSHRGGRKGLERLLTPLPVVLSKQKGKSLVFDDIWAGAYNTFARLKMTGEIYASGLNNYSQIGSGDSKNRYILQRIASFTGKTWIQIAGGQHHSLALDDAGHVYSCGRKEYGRLGLGKNTGDQHTPVAIPALKDVPCLDIACGTTVSYSVGDNGTAYAWGMGSSGQLGTGSEDDVWEPCPIRGKQLEGRHVLAVRGGGQHTAILATEAKTQGN